MSNKNKNKINFSFLKNKNIIIFILSFLLVFSVFFPITKKTNQELNNPYPLIDPLRSFISQEHFITNIEPLRQELRKLVSDYEKEGVKIGLYFEFLNTGANISINQELRFFPASLSKMPTIIAAMKKIENKEWELGNELILYYEDRDNGFGDLYKNQVGTRFTIEKLIKEVLVNSDNSAHRILMRNMEGQDFENMISALGMENMYDEKYNITAKEYSRIFRTLYTSSYLNREHSSLILEWLSETRLNEFLDSGVPENIKISHKIGEFDDESTYLDSGIVHILNRPYLITVMVNTEDVGGKEKAKQIMKEISEASYNYVSSY